MGGPFLHGDEAVRHRTAGVVVAVDADTDRVGAGAGQEAGHLRHGLAQFDGERCSIGVAENHGGGTSFGRRQDALQGVSGILQKRVEEVLGVVDHFLSLFAQKANRFGNHPQVLFAIHPQHFAHVEIPGLAHDGGDGYPTVRQYAEHWVFLRRHTPPPRHSECGQARTARQPLVGHAAEKLLIFRIGPWKTALNDVYAHFGQSPGNAGLLIHRHRESFPLHAIAEGGVIEDDVSVSVICCHCSPRSLRLSRRTRAYRIPVPAHTPGRHLSVSR